ncbi:hypothetical protein DPMN_114241 [Dreissena polymorpha]|uniref:Uncharacterized protein n=1 Tax=Dreissena polymorpha TaxID=45954 RepID=A0A9D4KIT9_DREPO|nr:hypothetical protein DPMN_114241 [Dreissena polymorpha]
MVAFLSFLVTACSDRCIRKSAATTAFSFWTHSTTFHNGYQPTVETRIDCCCISIRHGMKEEILSQVQKSTPRASTQATAGQTGRRGVMDMGSALRPGGHGFDPHPGCVL